jgi:hypothetical protein
LFRNVAESQQTALEWGQCPTSMGDKMASADFGFPTMFPGGRRMVHPPELMMFKLCLTPI